MHSYFWLTSSPTKSSIPEDVPYTTEALKQDLNRIRSAWEECQASRDRDAIYDYLGAVFNLIDWWKVDNDALTRSHRALRVHNPLPFEQENPFAAIIRCTADSAKVDKRARSKWSRVLRYALEHKDHSEPLGEFIKSKGGINKCAARFTNRLGRGSGCFR